MNTVSIEGFTGDIDQSEKTLIKYSTDASVCSVLPLSVAFPRTSSDMSLLVKYASEQGIPIAARSGGTCMSGGSLTSGIVVDLSRYMNSIGPVKLTEDSSYQISAQPGALYKDMDIIMAKDLLEMPVYPASKAIAGTGGMFANNCGGEKSLQHGKAANWIANTKHILSDGNEYIVKPLSIAELQEKISQNDFEGSIYKQIKELIEQNYPLIHEQKPKSSKNSAGYYLWNVWNRESGIFDLNQLLCGSQGTLGIATNIEWKLNPIEPASKMIVMMLPNLDQLGNIVNTLLEYKPDSIESYDDASMKLAVKFFPDFIQSMGIWGALKLGIQFLPELGMMLRGGVPKLILVAEWSGKTDIEIDEKLLPAFAAIKKYSYQSHIPKTDQEEQKYWKIRRESFNLLRKHLSGKRTAPFIDDVCVDPIHLPTFLPRLNALLDEYSLNYTIAGHAGNGNFHIIPLMDFHNPKTGSVLLELSDKVYTLVAEYGGSITAEHNDGIIRTPYLHYMFSPDMLDLFQRVKTIFDPKNIFNPGKKVGGTVDFLEKHIIKE